MSLETLETIVTDLKRKGLNFLEVKADKKVVYVLQDFIYAITGLSSSNNVFDILYIDNGKLNIVEDGRFKYIIIREQDNYKVLNMDILNYPTNELLK